jgi:hypothetical protein
MTSAFSGREKIKHREAGSVENLAPVMAVPTPDEADFISYTRRDGEGCAWGA